MDDHAEPPGTSDLDRRLTESDLTKLAAMAGTVSKPVMMPPFYNCFVNTFANSPNFTKRLGPNPTLPPIQSQRE